MKLMSKIKELSSENVSINWLKDRGKIGYFSRFAERKGHTPFIIKETNTGDYFFSKSFHNIRIAFARANFISFISRMYFYCFLCNGFCYFLSSAVDTNFFQEGTLYFQINTTDHFYHRNFIFVSTVLNSIVFTVVFFDISPSAFDLTFRQESAL